MKTLVAALASALIAIPAFAQQAQDKKSDTRQSMSDAGLTGKVKSALAADVGTKTLRGVDVDSDKGVVTLKGHVDSSDTKQRAEAVAKKVSGVKSVKNQLSIRKPKD